MNPIKTGVAKEFEAALERAGLSEFFADCTDAHRREYLKWVTEAKRPETRTQRIEKALKMLSAKRAEETERTRA